MTPLFAELHRWAALPFAWGECDCVLAAADWVARATGHDPAEGLRMTYGSPGECERVTRFFSDPVGLVGPRLARAGLVPTEAPVRGDVGLVRLFARGALRPHGAVCIGKAWAAKGEQGVTSFRIAEGQLIAAWAVGYRDA